MSDLLLQDDSVSAADGDAERPIEAVSKPGRVGLRESAIRFGPPLAVLVAVAALAAYSIVGAFVVALPAAWWIGRKRGEAADGGETAGPPADELRAMVDRQLPVLPLLAAQLEDVASEVESSVTGVCGNFQEMVTQARAVVNEVSSALTTTTDTGDNHSALITTARGTLQNLLDRIVESSKASMQLIYRMEDVERGMGEVLHIISDVERIARQTKLLALNASIEAARAGEHGRAFASVATEVTKLAEHSARTSQRVSGVVRTLATDLSSTHDTLKGLASTDMTAALSSQTEVDAAICSLQSSNEKLRDSARSAAEGGERLADQIGRAIMALQFQDATSQRIDHVVRALGGAEQALRSCIDGQGETGGSGHELIGQLAEAYTMDTERRVLARLTEGEASGDQAPDEGSTVELF